MTYFVFLVVESFLICVIMLLIIWILEVLNASSLVMKFNTKVTCVLIWFHLVFIPLVTHSLMKHVFRLLDKSLLLILQPCFSLNIVMVLHLNLLTPANSPREPLGLLMLHHQCLGHPIHLLFGSLAIHQTALSDIFTSILMGLIPHFLQFQHPKLVTHQSKPVQLLIL